MTQLCVDPKQFATRLLHWQRSHGRHQLPWQENPTPYRVLVSEIMLQQTQVITVIPYFERWMERFPDIHSLARANEDEVLSLWQGLGYYSRARNLQKAARYVIDELGGEFPDTVDGMLKIPGVGRYTAGALISFAYNRPGPIVDGNVKRVFCRQFAIEGVPGTTVVDKKLWQLAELLTPTEDNRDFAQGLLDLGATLCTPKSPDCPRCPFSDSCIAHIEGRTAELPTPKPKKNTPTRQGHFLWIRSQDKLLLEKRPDTGIWASLWCLPEIPVKPQLAGARAFDSFRHTFSHYKLEAQVWQQESPDTDKSSMQWFSPRQLAEVGLPAPIRKLVEKQLTSQQVELAMID
ncbi:A/G-specific adenine glycosylase [Dongshaea marina]|uniref:A/G-specific adenine glycosylase n=1 Tax=Dongshaea marina TaxID=2047966 RepID=UPI000D3EC44A|nr:A/G-specific adenine glycosylase [Dongshaea marina]